MLRKDTDELIAFLNELLALDAQAVTDLINSRVQCSEAMANHPTVQVGGVTGRPETFRVGLLGLLNGYCGVYDEGDKKGCGPITAVFDDGIVTGFRRTQS